MNAISKRFDLRDLLDKTDLAFQNGEVFDKLKQNTINSFLIGWEKTDSFSVHITAQKTGNKRGEWLPGIFL